MIDVHDHKQQNIFKTRAIVEATSCEKRSLWNEWHCDRRYTWVADTAGYGICVGEFGGMEVWISISWATVNGVHVMFYEDTSMVVDHRLINQWKDQIIESIKNESGAKVVCSDAANFHNVFR